MEKQLFQQNVIEFLVLRIIRMARNNLISAKNLGMVKFISYRKGCGVYNQLRLLIL